MYLIVQNILLLYFHFGMAFFQPPQFLNSETVRLVSFLIISFPLYGTSFRLPTGKCISSLRARYPYRNSYLLNLISTFLDSKYTGKTSHSDDLIRIVRNSCITYFHLTTLRLRTSTFYMFYTSCQEYGTTAHFNRFSSILHRDVIFLSEKPYYISNIWTPVLHISRHQER